MHRPMLISKRGWKSTDFQPNPQRSFVTAQRGNREVLALWCCMTHGKSRKRLPRLTACEWVTESSQ